MSGLRRILAALGAAFRRREMDADMDAEFASHLEMAAADFEKQGLSPAEASREALAALGGTSAAREQHRDSRSLPLVETIAQDLRYGFRTLRRDAGLALFAILITGLGVGASATVFSVVQTVLLRELPFQNPERLTWIANDNGPGLSSRTIQVDHLLDMRKLTRSFSEIGAYFAFYGTGDMQMTGQGEPERLTAVPVTGNFFHTLGVEVQIGRQFTEAETQINGPGAVILTHEFWKNRMNANPAVVGTALTLNNNTFTIAGVLPASFDFSAAFAPGQKIDVFRPFPLSPETNRQGNTLSVVGRLKPAVTPAGAQAELQVFATQMTREHPERNEIHLRLTPLRESISGSVKTAMWVLCGAIGLVMLIVCANLSNLLLARATSREKEIAIRAALGAGRARLIRQMLTESLLLSGAGGLLGLALAAAGTRVIAGLETKIPLLNTVQLDWTVAAFALFLAMGTGIAFGLLPALRVSGFGLHGSMQASSRGTSAGREHAWLRGALVAGEVALACLLLVGTGLLIRSFLRLLEVDLGFKPEQALTVRIDTRRRFEDRAARNAYYRDALTRIAAIPGVESAGLTDNLPYGTNRSWGAGAKGKVYTRGNYPDAFVRVVTDGYIRSMGIPLRRGRDIAPSDQTSDKRVILINETLARSLWPGEDPIGKVMRADGEREVIGVVGDVRHLTLEQGSGNEMYIPFWQSGDYSSINLVLRGTGTAQDIEARVRQQLRAMDPNLPIPPFRPLQGIVDSSMSPRRLIVISMTAFAGFALLLASLGIYGVISYSVAQRQKELGIRMALGASASALRRGILLQTLRLAATGMTAGLLASLAGVRLLTGLLYGIEPSDPPTFALALLALAAVALAAGYFPARRASRLSPVEALRLD